jgi:uncharacterized protein YdaU (DUF1376 family)
MAQFPALNVWTDSWLADTAHLPRVDRDIYFHLLILMWRSPNCRVPNEIGWIARKLSCPEAEIPMLQSVIREFCKSSGNWLTQKRLTKEYKLARVRSKLASDKAKSRWNKDKNSCRGNASITTTITTNTTIPPIAPQGGREGNSGAMKRGRKQGYSNRESFAQAVEYIDSRRNLGGQEGGTDDPVLLSRLRESAA